MDILHPDDENFETIEVGEEVPAQADFGIALNGDSMEPRYHDKQAVWFTDKCYKQSRALSPYVVFISSRNFSTISCSI